MNAPTALSDALRTGSRPLHTQAERTGVMAALLRGTLDLAGYARLLSALHAVKSVVSANPIGLLFDFFNAEYERAMSTTSTVGIGGSTISSTNDYTDESERSANLDVFYRYYPSGSPFAGRISVRKLVSRP